MFCVVYANVGTNLYYAPGILHESLGNLATLAQLVALVVFASIARRYVELCERCPDGGGVVSICAQAFPKRRAIVLAGGAFITINYFLTSALGAVAAIFYLQTLAGFDRALVVPLTLACLGLLLWLNIVGQKETARTTAVLIAVKLGVNLALLVLGALHLTERDAWGALFDHVFHPTGAAVGAGALLVGYADTWIAYAGLESAAQLSANMVRPIGRTASRAMWAVIGAVSLLSPLLTAYCTFLLPPAYKTGAPETFLAGLAELVGGTPLQVLTVVSAVLLLLTACNFAIVGNYHVNMRLVEAGLLPRWLGRRNHRYGTPHISILLSALVPMLIIVLTGGHITALGDLYAFGLLGALTLSSLSLDVVRWREARRGLGFVWGVLTSLALALAWSLHLWHKPMATLYGGAVSLVFVGVALAYGRGLFRPLARRVPQLSSDIAEETAEQDPAAAELCTLTEALELRDVEHPQVMLAVRTLDEALLRGAAERVRATGGHSLYVVYVEEIPGLLYPPKHGPSPDAQRVLRACTERLKSEYGLLAVPIWRLAHDAARSLASAAEKLDTKVLVIGRSQRTPMWRLLRGSVVHGLTRHLPESCRLVIVS